MQLKIYQIDAFASRVFAGNPAAVCPLERWLDDATMQAIALENNLSETAFFVPTDAGFAIRWFTPITEVDLCGHATLASAFVLFHLLGDSHDRVTFASRSGDLIVERQGDILCMDFPAQPPQPAPIPAVLPVALGRKPVEVLAAADYIAVFATEDDVRELTPDLALLKQLGLRGIAVTAPGQEADFVSRFFAPKAGIDEDPVTGSSHCELAPYWAARFDHPKLRAQQLSRRGGEVLCEVRGDRVLLGGRAARYLEGVITI